MLSCRAVSSNPLSVFATAARVSTATDGAHLDESCANNGELDDHAATSRRPGALLHELRGEVLALDAVLFFARTKIGEIDRQEGPVSAQGFVPSFEQRYFVRVTEVLSDESDKPAEVFEHPV